jgi:hypothetical protein
MEQFVCVKGKGNMMIPNNLTLPINITYIIMTLVVVFFQISLTSEFDFAQAYVLSNRTLPDFNFAAAGDWGCTPISENTIDSIIKKDPELVLGLGDYSYENKADCWLQLVDPLDHKMKIVIGNHDHQFYITNTTTYPSPLLLKQYMNHFNLSKQFYSFNYQNVHFIAMSTEIPYEHSSDQYEFVESDLEAAASDPDIDWIIVFYHRLAYSSLSLLDSIPKIRNTYHPLFEKYDVDLVIQAHSHNYQRSFPIIYNNRTTSEPIITDSNKTSYLNPSGQIFTTVGTGGAPDLHKFTTLPTRFTAIQFNAYGFLNIEVLHNGTILEGKFYENNGTIRDHFTITKPKSETSSSLIASPKSSPRLTNNTEGKFKIETVFKGFESPTDMQFLEPKNPNDIIVLEKNKGTVQRIVRDVQDDPLIHVNVSSKSERGLLEVIA